MANDNIEVEIKTKVSKDKFQQIEKVLKKKAKFIKSSHHIDNYYSPVHNSFLKPKYPYEWLSIRDRSGKTILNYKHWYPEGVKDTTHCDEYETEVTDKNQLEKILNVINVKKLVSVDKKRSTYIYNKDIEVAMDEVKSLGYFIEAESLDNKDGVDKTYKRLEDFLKVLGVKKLIKIPGGYAAELMRKKGLMKN